MRKIAYIYTIACVMVVIFGSTSCTDEYLMKSSIQTEMKDFSLQEAKDFFTKQIEETVILSRSIDNKENRGVSPGDFVPDWSTSVGSSMNGLACYDIPIAPTYRYRAVYVDERNGLPSAGKVNVYQKLVIVKDVKSKELSQYILTLIPSKTCDNKYGPRLCTDFINCADKGGFTGVAIYSCVNSNMTARVSKYKNGKKIDGVFLLNASSKADFADKYERAYALVSNVDVQRMSKVMTRGEVEEEPSWDGGSLPEVVITPEEPDYGWGEKDMEDCLESSRPNGTVDPEPEENPNNNPWEWGGQDGWEGDNVTVDYTELGNEGINKIRSDLKNGNVKIQQVKMSQGQAALTAVSVGLNTNGIITSCLSFMDEAKVGVGALKFGQALGGVGAAVGLCQTVVAVIDGDVSNADIVGAISTALGIISIVTAPIPIVSGVTGVASCVLGLVSSMMTSDLPDVLEIQLENGSTVKVHLYYPMYT